MGGCTRNRLFCWHTQGYIVSYDDSVLHGWDNMQRVPGETPPSRGGRNPPGRCTPPQGMVGIGVSVGDGVERESMEGECAEYTGTEEEEEDEAQQTSNRTGYNEQTALFSIYILYI